MLITCNPISDTVFLLFFATHSFERLISHLVPKNNKPEIGCITDFLQSISFNTLTLEKYLPSASIVWPLSISIQIQSLASGAVTVSTCSRLIKYFPIDTNFVMLTSNCICIDHLVHVPSFQFQPMIQEFLDIKGVLLIKIGGQLIIRMLRQVIFI